ncbi:hypothetical protein C0992_008259 [Termitomyces sp. T32_za158]|nr:hypothetical protein C0992_008259 [Termitomyces sp. T32_za158]
MQRKRASLLAQYGQDNGMMSPELKRKLENRADATLQGKKRPRTSGDFGERENTTDSGTKTKKKKLKEQVEYQTSAEMYNKLNICSKTKKYLFNGRFSIIANPEIDNNKRVTIVAKDLRKLGNVPFEGTSIKSFVGEDIFGATFQCSCLDPGTRKPVATLYNRNPNEIAFSPAGFVVHTPTNDIPRCKGTIKVISQDDDSHPLGIAGQKITIIVEH